MNRNVLRLLALGLALSAGALRATEIRSPLICEQGPLRHILQKEGTNESSQWETWSAGYSREAHTAFKEHGVKTQSLASLVFNKDNFKMSEIFANCYVPLNAENYNPFLRTARLVPNIRYSEQGLTLGAQWSTEGFGGRWGVRGSVSFRAIEQESLQDIYGKGSRVEDVKLTTYPRVLQANSVTNAPQEVSHDKPLTVLRYDIAEAAFQNDTRQSYLTINTFPGVAGDAPTEFMVGTAREMIAGTLANENMQNRYNFAFVYNPGAPVRPPAVGAFDGNNPLVDGGTGVASTIASRFQPLPLKASQLQANTFYYVPSKATDSTIIAPYLDFITPQGASSPASDLAYQEMKENLWLVQSIQPDTDVLGTQYGEFLETSMNVGLQDWLLDQGFKFEDARIAGMGDTPVEAFYQYNFFEELMGELVLGVRLPTGTNARYVSNPLITKTGNGGHTEFKLGAMLVWQAWEKISIKADVSYSVALKAREQRAAAFVGANIKNIGPRADADVSWGYLVGHLDFNFMHPQTDSYNFVLGYELYLKGKDNVKFKQASVQSWLGGTIDTTSILQDPTLALDAVANPPVGGTYAVTANPQLLNNALAAQNTNSIGHKIRFESAIRFNEWVEVFLGGSFTFAGQNLPRETDAHAGIHLNY